MSHTTDLERLKKLESKIEAAAKRDEKLSDVELQAITDMLDFDKRDVLQCYSEAEGPYVHNILNKAIEAKENPEILDELLGLNIHFDINSLLHAIELKSAHAVDRFLNNHRTHLIPDINSIGYGSRLFEEKRKPLTTLVKNAEPGALSNPNSFESKALHMLMQHGHEEQAAKSDYVAINQANRAFKTVGAYLWAGVVWMVKAFVRLVTGRQLSLFDPEPITPTLDVDKEDGDGWTPLLYATAESNLEMVEALLKNGANPNKAEQLVKRKESYTMGENKDEAEENYNGNTPLFNWALAPRQDKTIAYALLKSGANVDQKNEHTGESARDKIRPSSPIYKHLSTTRRSAKIRSAIVGVLTLGLYPLAVTLHYTARKIISTYSDYTQARATHKESESNAMIHARRAALTLQIIGRVVNLPLMLVELPLVSLLNTLFKKEEKELTETDKMSPTMLEEWCALYEADCGVKHSPYQLHQWHLNTQKQANLGITNTVEAAITAKECPKP